MVEDGLLEVSLPVRNDVDLSVVSIHPSNLFNLFDLLTESAVGDNMAAGLS